MKKLIIFIVVAALGAGVFFFSPVKSVVTGIITKQQTKQQQTTKSAPQLKAPSTLAPAAEAAPRALAPVMAPLTTTQITAADLIIKYVDKILGWCASLTGILLATRELKKKKRATATDATPAPTKRKTPVKK